MQFPALSTNLMEEAHLARRTHICKKKTKLKIPKPDIRLNAKKEAISRTWIT